MSGILTENKHRRRGDEADTKSIRDETAIAFIQQPMISVSRLVLRQETRP